MAKAKLDVPDLPEIKVTPTIDFSLNKNDLIEILVDDYITKIEQEVERLQVLHEDMGKELDKLRQNVALQLLIHVQKNSKLFTSAVVKSYTKPSLLSLYRDIIEYNYSLSIAVENKVTIKIETSSSYYRDAKSYVSELVKEVLNHAAEMQKVFNTIAQLNIEKKDLIKSPQRVKARLIKNFLVQNKSGQQILNLIGSTDLKDTMKLITAATKEK